MEYAAPSGALKMFRLCFYKDAASNEADGRVMDASAQCLRRAAFRPLQCLSGDGRNDWAADFER